jgi:hypothetical protein
MFQGKIGPDSRAFTSWREGRGGTSIVARCSITGTDHSYPSIIRLPAEDPLSEMSSNIQREKIALNVRRYSPQPSIFVRSFSAITTSREKLLTFLTIPLSLLIQRSATCFLANCCFFLMYRKVNKAVLIGRKQAKVQSRMNNLVHESFSYIAVLHWFSLFLQKKYVSYGYMYN